MNPYEAGFVNVTYFSPVEMQSCLAHHDRIWLVPTRPYNYEIDSPEFRSRVTDVLSSEYLQQEGLHTHGGRWCDEKHPNGERELIEITLPNGRHSVGYQ